MVILENIDIDIDIDKAILQIIDIDKISNRFKFGISNRARGESAFERKEMSKLIVHSRTIFKRKHKECQYNTTFADFLCAWGGAGVIAMSLTEQGTEILKIKQC